MAASIRCEIERLKRHRGSMGGESSHMQMNMSPSQSEGSNSDSDSAPMSPENLSADGQRRKGLFTYKQVGT